jgi:anoctamin-10
MPADGGLGITHESPEWSRVQSIMALHDTEFNEVWLRSLTNKQVRTEHLDTIRSQVRLRSVPVECLPNLHLS